MRYWSRSLAGVVLVAVSIALASVFLYDLVRTGSCASGGPYVSARPCPAGTGWRIAGLMATIFPLPAAGLAILSTRAPGRKLAGALAVGPLWFVLLFTCMGAGALVAGVGPAATDEGGSRTASYIVAGTFLLIGGPALLAMLRGGGSQQSAVGPWSGRTARVRDDPARPGATARTLTVVVRPGGRPAEGAGRPARRGPDHARRTPGEARRDPR